MGAWLDPATDIFRPDPPRPVRPWRVLAGLAMASVVHLPSIVLISYLGLRPGLRDDLYVVVPAMLAIAALTCAGLALCVSFGVWFIARNDVGIGIGLVAGWLVVPAFLALVLLQ